MSNSNELENKDEGSSRYYANEKGYRFHEDNLGAWFMKNSGYESLTYYAIIDESFKTAVYTIMQGLIDNKGKSFQYLEKWFTIFMNVEEPEKSQVNRKSVKKITDITDGADFTETASNEVKQSTTGGGGGGTTYTNAQGKTKRDRAIPDKYRWIKQTLEESEQDLVLEPFWQVCKNSNPNTFLVQEGDQSFVRTRLEHITYYY